MPAPVRPLPIHSTETNRRWSAAQQDVCRSWLCFLSDACQFLQVTCASSLNATNGAWQVLPLSCCCDRQQLNYPQLAVYLLLHQRCLLHCTVLPTGAATSITAIRFADLPESPEVACASPAVRSAWLRCKVSGPSPSCCGGLDAVLASRSSPSFG